MEERRYTCKEQREGVEETQGLVPPEPEKESCTVNCESPFGQQCLTQLIMLLNISVPWGTLMWGENSSSVSKRSLLLNFPSASVWGDCVAGQIPTGVAGKPLPLPGSRYFSFPQGALTWGENGSSESKKRLLLVFLFASVSWDCVVGTLTTMKNSDICHIL